MPDALPPPVTDDEVAAPGWYTDPDSPELLRWWDGEAWSETDIKLPGDDGYRPWWYPTALTDRIGPFTRVGSVGNVVICGFMIGGTISSGLARDLLSVAPLLGMEAIFIGVAAWVWWRGPIRLDQIAAWVFGRD